jgi:hypothetical protein
LRPTGNGNCRNGTLGDESWPMIDDRRVHVLCSPKEGLKQPRPCILSRWITNLVLALAMPGLAVEFLLNSRSDCLQKSLNNN